MRPTAGILEIPEKPLIAKIIYFTSLATLIIGGCLFIYSTAESIHFTIKFPAGSDLQNAVWLMHTSVRFLALWMPFALVLARLSSQDIVLGVIYLGGCIIAIILSIAATVIISIYAEPGHIKKEYATLVTKSLESNKRFPFAIRNMISFENCCGWSGSVDFGTRINIEKYVDDETFMKEDIRPCYGYNDTLTINSLINSGDTAEINEKPNSKNGILQGCQIFYKRLFRRICHYIATVGLIVDIVAVIFIVLYVMLFISGKNQKAELNKVHGQELNETELNNESPKE